MTDRHSSSSSRQEDGSCQQAFCATGISCMQLLLQRGMLALLLLLARKEAGDQPVAHHMAILDDLHRDSVQYTTNTECHATNQGAPAQSSVLIATADCCACATGPLTSSHSAHHSRMMCPSSQPRQHTCRTARPQGSQAPSCNLRQHRSCSSRSYCSTARRRSRSTGRQCTALHCHRGTHTAR
jgi:hypothetical protein